MPTKKKINGQPMSHWKKMAEELVIDVLVRASLDYGWGREQSRSIVQELAAEKLMELAVVENPEIVKKLLEERDCCIAGCTAILKYFMKK